MMYTIGQVSQMFDIPISTLRYYDKEGLFPDIQRTSGIRRFGEKELEAIRVIECLKKSGMEIKDIKQFMEWCTKASKTYPKRLDLFVRQCIRHIDPVDRHIAEGPAGSLSHRDADRHLVCTCAGDTAWQRDRHVQRPIAVDAGYRQ